MNYQELKAMDQKTLNGKLDTLRRELFELKMEKRIKQQARGLDKPHQLKLKRKQVARILTALTAMKQVVL